MVDVKKSSWTIASDVGARDGIGIELEIDRFQSKSASTVLRKPTYVRHPNAS